MVAASEARLLRSKSEGYARELVKVQDGNTRKAYRGFAAVRSTTASPSGLDLTKSSKGIGGSKSCTLKRNGSDQVAKNNSDEDDAIKMTKRSGSSIDGGMGLLIRRMSSSGSKSAALERNNDEASDEKVVKSSSKAEGSGNDDTTPNDNVESEHKRQPPPQSAEDDSNLRHSTMKLVQYYERCTDSESRDTKCTIERGSNPTPPLPIQIPRTSSMDSKRKPNKSKTPCHSSSFRSCTPEINSTKKPESSTILRSSTGQSTNSQKGEIKKTNSKATSTREGLPPIPVVRSSDINLKEKVDTPQQKSNKKSSSGPSVAGSTAIGVASIRRSVSGWRNKPIRSSEIKRCSSESAGNRFGHKLTRSGSNMQGNIVTKNSNSEERKNLVKPGGIFEQTRSEGVVSKNTSKSLQSISCESNHSSLIKVTHSKASIIKINTPVRSMSGEMMASSFTVSPREEHSSELGLEIVCSMDAGKPILRAESAIAGALSSENHDDDDEKREDAVNEGGRENLCISTSGLCTPSSKGVSGLEDDMKHFTFGYGYSLYVKSLEIYQRELEMKKMEENTNENQEQETENNREEKHDEQEEKRDEEKQNAEWAKVQGEEQSQSSDSSDSSDSDDPVETTVTGRRLAIITVVETTKIKQFSEHVASSTVTTATTSTKPTAEDAATSRTLVEEDKNEKAKKMFGLFGSHQWKQLMQWCVCFHT